MILTQLVERAVLLNADGLATIDGDRKRTWLECRDRVAKLAGALLKIGITPGDRIAILAANSDRYFEYYFAVFWADAVAVPMNTRWSVPENIYSIEDSTPGILFVDDAFVDHARGISDACDIIKTLIYMGDGDTPEGMLNMEALIAESEPVADAERGYEDLAAIFYTGGTTGFPKGVMLSHRNLWSSGIMGVAEDGEKYMGPYLHIAPMFHVGDFSFVVSATMQARTHVFAPSFDPEQALNTMAKYRVEQSMLVPTMIKMLIDHPNFDEYDLSGFKSMTYGASPMPLTTLHEAMVKLPHTDFIQGLGQTEMAPLITRLPAADHDPDGPNSHRLKSAGRPIIGVAVKVVDKDLQEVPRGEVGEFMVAGPNAMQGYWNKPQQTAATLINGWLLTGDAGYMDKDGYIYLVDRFKDMIVSGGENIFSAEVENAVLSHEAVNEAAVIGIPNEQWGETVLAIVILKDGCEVTEEDLIAHCKSLIAGYKCPRSVEFRTESLPLSGVGKVLKNELRKPYWEDQDRSIS